MLPSVYPGEVPERSRYESLKVYNHSLLGELAGRRTPWRANAAASLHTTAGDYARFVAAVLAGKGLRPETARALMSPQSRPDERGINTATAAPTGRFAPSLAWGLGYERSLQLNPANTGGAEALKRLRAAGRDET